MLKTTLLFAMLATPCYADNNTAIAVIVAPPVVYFDNTPRLPYGATNPHVITLQPRNSKPDDSNEIECVAGCDDGD